MLTLVVATAAALGVILIGTLLAVLVFAIQTGTLIAETAAALQVVDERARGIAGRLERIQHATHVAAGDLTATEV